MSNASSPMLTIVEGRNHIVKRMFEAVGKKVVYLEYPDGHIEYAKEA